MEKKKVNVVKIGDIIVVPKGMTPRDIGSFHRSLENRQLKSQAKIKKVKQKKGKKSKKADPSYLNYLDGDDIQAHIDSTTNKINAVAKNARNGDLIVVPDIHVGARNHELMEADQMTKEDLHTLAVKSLANHILSDSAYKVSKQRNAVVKNNKEQIVTTVTKIELKPPRRFGSYIQDNEKILLAEGKNFKTYRKLEKEYQQNNEEIRKEWNRMLEEKRRIAREENIVLQNELNQADLMNKEVIKEENLPTCAIEDIETCSVKQSDKDHNANDIFCSFSEPDAPKDTAKSDDPTSSQELDKTRVIKAPQCNTDTLVAMATDKALTTPNKRKGKSLVSRLRGLFACFSCSRKTTE